MITKLVGAPGSGKTTKLLKFAEREAMEYNTPLDDLMFLTFSKTAREEAQERITEVYPDAEKDDLKRSVKTVHGAALSACLAEGRLDLRNSPDDDGWMLIRKQRNKDIFEWFFKKHFPAIDYRTDVDDPIEQLQEGEVTETPPGNSVLAAYDYVKSMNWPLSQYHRAPVDIDLPQPKILEVLKGWEEYKEKNKLLQDDDYVKIALDDACRPQADVLIIDEFQDLSPLQYALYEQWRNVTDRVYIAGDSRQSIYGFRGAEAKYFQETPADEVVNNQESKRCPQAVIDSATSILEPVHDVSQVTAMRSGGVTDHVFAPNAADLSQLVTDCVEEHGEVYLLARTNRQTGKLAWGLRDGGIPYLDLKPNGALKRWREPMPELLSALRRFDREQSIPVDAAETLLENATDKPSRHDMTVKPTNPLLGNVVTAEEYREWFPSCNSGVDVISRLTVDDWQLDLLRGALRSGTTHQPEQVRIGTVHSAKGLEAPCVLLFPAYTHKMKERFHNGSEKEERRLYYVGLTRAKDTALVVHDYFGGDEFPPLSE